MIFGKIVPYLLLASLDLTVIVGVGMVLFGVPFVGSVATFALGALLFLLVTLGMGVLISTVSQNQGQAIQLAIMFVVPQILMSGLIFPISSMAAGVRWIAYVLPLSYFIDISRGVMLKDTPITALWQQLVVLAGMARSCSASPCSASGVTWHRAPGTAGSQHRSPSRFAVTWGLESASVRFGTRTALPRCHPESRARHVSVVVGGDGAGKSTLLRALVGLVPLTAASARRPSKEEVGYVPATAGLYIDLTVEENLAFSGGAYGVAGRAGPRTTEHARTDRPCQCPGPPRGPALGRDAAEAGGRDGAFASPGPTGPGRADHRCRSGEPIRAAGASSPRRQPGEPPSSRRRHMLTRPIALQL